MKRNSFRQAVLPGVAILALGLSACGAGNEPSSDGGSDGGSDGSGIATDLTGTLKGAGATSQEKAQEAWTTAAQGANSGFEVQYNLVGSTDGRSQFVSGAVSFAGSDSYLNDDEGELSDAKDRCSGTDPIEVPAYVSPIAVAFNLQDANGDAVSSLDLDADTIAQIFDNKITTWDDPAIADQNPDVDLPSTDINPVHRSDDSGTTKNFTDYLNKASDSWPYPADDPFPVSGGESAEGTSGVVKLIQSNDGYIGYADDSQVGDLSTVAVKVGSDFNEPSADGAALALDASPRVDGRPDVDMAFDLDRTTTESGAYPIVLVSYLIACQTYDDEQEAANVKGYLSYIVSADGQNEAASYAGSAPLSEDTASEAQGIVEKISAG